VRDSGIVLHCFWWTLAVADSALSATAVPQTRGRVPFEVTCGGSCFKGLVRPTHHSTLHTRLAYVGCNPLVTISQPCVPCTLKYVQLACTEVPALAPWAILRMSPFCEYVAARDPRVCCRHGSSSANAVGLDSCALCMAICCMPAAEPLASVWAALAADMHCCQAAWETHG
jgi:hypothetical protein